ncbi:MAG: fibronectin type III domain-containing protein, partial [Patescibacteria group bacterium]
GYSIGSASGCNGYLSGSTYTTGTITSNCTVSASFNNIPPQTYTVSTYAGTGGNISPSSRTVNAGATTTFTVSPNSGYSIGSVTGCNGYLSGNVYNTGAITSNCTVSASFSAIPNPIVTTPTGLSAYAVSTSQINVSWNSSTGGNGTQIAYNIYRCTGAGCTANQYIDWGYSTNYQNTGLTCNTTYGYRVRAYDSTPTFSGYSNTAYATTFPCQSQTYTVSTYAGTGGNISPTSQLVTSGATTTFTVTPYSGYSISSVSGCNGYLSGNTFTTGIITSNCTVSASFSAVVNSDPYVKLTADNQNVTYNGNTTLRWSAINAVSCTASGTSNYWYGNVGVSGPWNTGTLTNTTTYNITCTGASGTTPASDSVTVNVQTATCQDPSATNYRGTLPCNYLQTCQDPSANNYRGASPCTYPPAVCQDPNATNYRGALPCDYYQPILTCR